MSEKGAEVICQETERHTYAGARIDKRNVISRPFVMRLRRVGRYVENETS